MSNLDDALTTRDVAAARGVTVRQIARLVEKGDLVPIVKLPGKRGAYLFAREQLEAGAE